MMAAFAAYGLERLSLRNKLDVEENARLATSNDIHEIIGLLVKGLVRHRTPNVQ